MLATWSGVTSAVEGLREVERSTVRIGMPSALSRSRMKLSSRPFVSKVPATMAVRPRRSANGIEKIRAPSGSGCDASTIDCRRLVAGMFQRSESGALGRRVADGAAAATASPRSTR